jgi:hypothetical protein
MFVVKKRDLFKMNSDVHICNMRSNQDLHLPSVNLTVFQKGGWYSGITFYDHLPLTLKRLSYDIPGFKGALNKFLATNSFTRWKNIIVGNKDFDHCKFK